MCDWEELAKGGVDTMLRQNGDFEREEAYGRLPEIRILQLQ